MLSINTNNSVEKELLLTKKILLSIIEGNAAGIFVVDEFRDIIMTNQRFCDIVDYSKEEIIGKNACFLHISQESCEQFGKTFLKAKNEGHVKIEYFISKKGCGGVWAEMFGSPIQLDESAKGVIWSVVDISERKAAEETIKKFAFYDALTGLVNRRLLEDRLDMIMRNKQREESLVAIFFLDLDNFKPLNDIYGHQAGDLFLKEVASRLLGSIRSRDTVARFGGDEFVIIVDGLNQIKTTAKEEAQLIANKILETLSATYVIDTIVGENKVPTTIEHHSTASIGFTLLQEDDKRSDSLIRRADKAMYQAKESGKNCIKFL